MTCCDILSVSARSEWVARYSDSRSQSAVACLILDFWLKVFGSGIHIALVMTVGITGPQIRLHHISGISARNQTVLAHYIACILANHYMKYWLQKYDCSSKLFFNWWAANRPTNPKVPLPNTVSYALPSTTEHSIQAAIATSSPQFAADPKTACSVTFP